MIIPEMVADSTITEKVFSWYLSNEAGKSYIDFGAPNSSVYKSSELIYMPIKSDSDYWTSSIKGVRWSTNSNEKTEYKVTERNALTDTGSSCITGPAGDIEYLRNTILNLIPGVSEHDGWSY